MSDLKYQKICLQILNETIEYVPLEFSNAPFWEIRHFAETLLWEERSDLGKRKKGEHFVLRGNYWVFAEPTSHEQAINPWPFEIWAATLERWDIWMNYQKKPPLPLKQSTLNPSTLNDQQIRCLNTILLGTESIYQIQGPVKF